MFEILKIDKNAVKEQREKDKEEFSRFAEEGKRLANEKKLLREELWNAQSDETKKNFFYARVLLFSICVPISILTFFFWKIGLVAGFIVSAILYFVFRKKKQVLQFVPLISAVVGIFLGFLFLAFFRLV